MPLFEVVAARATISGVGEADADSSNVLIPEVLGAGLPLAHEKVKLTSVGKKFVVGEKERTKLWLAPEVMLVGVLMLPDNELLKAFVVW